MPVSGTSTFKSFAGNASTSTYYPLLPDIEYAATTEIEGTADGVALVNGVDFTVNLTSGVLTTAAYASGVTLIFYRVTPLTQPSSFPSGETPLGAAVETGLDKIVRQVQEADAQWDRALKAPRGVAGDALPQTAERFWYRDDSGDLIEFSDAQMAAIVQAQLNISSGAVADKGTTTFANATARGLAVPDFTGQMGLQLDTEIWYRSNGLSAGDWTADVLDEDDMVSDSANQVPTQQSTKAYVDQLTASRFTSTPKLFGTSTLLKPTVYIPQLGLDKFELDSAGAIDRGLIGGQIIDKQDVTRFGQATSLGLDWDTTTPFQITDGNDNNYNGWPHITCRYDPDRDQVVLLYTSGSQHSPNVSHNTYCRVLANASQKDFQALSSGDWSDRVIVFDGVIGGTSLPTYVQAFVITASGDYIMWTSQVDTTGAFWDDDEDQYRIVSTDGGVTWARDTAKLKDDAGVDEQFHYVMSMERLSNGRLLGVFSKTSGGSTVASIALSVRYSDDNGKRWKAVNNYNDRAFHVLYAGGEGSNDTRHSVWEPVFVETSPGEGIVMARGDGLHTSTYGNLLWARWSNYGEDFTTWQQTGLPAHSNPCGVVALPDFGVVEILYGARGTSGTVGLYQASATIQSALAGQFANEGKIFTSLSTSDVTDFGYPWTVRVGNQVLGVYYDDPTDTTNIADIFCIGATIGEKAANTITHTETAFRTPLLISDSLLLNGGTLGIVPMGGNFSPRAADGVGSGYDNIVRGNDFTLLAGREYSDALKPDAAWNSSTQALDFTDPATELLTDFDAPAGITFLGFHVRAKITDLSTTTTTRHNIAMVIDRPTAGTANQGQPLIWIRTDNVGSDEYYFQAVPGLGGTTYTSDKFALSGVSGADHLFSVYVDPANSLWKAYLDGVEVANASTYTMSESAWAASLRRLYVCVGSVRSDYTTTTQWQSPTWQASGAFGLFTTKTAFDAAMTEF